MMIKQSDKDTNIMARYFDPAFRTRLRADPKRCAIEMGWLPEDIGDDIQVVVKTNCKQIYYLAIIENKYIKETDIAQIAAGRVEIGTAGTVSSASSLGTLGCAEGTVSTASSVGSIGTAGTAG